MLKNFNDDKFNCICLQETHVTDDVIDVCQREWNGEIVYNSFTERSCGQMILLKKSCNFQCTVICNTTRILAINLNNEDINTLIVNIYAPNNNLEKQIFFAELN